MKNAINEKELSLIQDIIKRMADNSFKVKTWMLSITAGVLALSKDVLFTEGKIDNSTKLGILAFMILLILLFWYLDGFFLRTEKLYQNLYKWVIKYRPLTDAYLYDLNTFTRNYQEETINLQEQTDSILKVMVNKTLLPFYLIPLLFIFIIIF